MENNNNKNNDKITTLEIQVTSREELWAKVYEHAIKHGFAADVAASQSDKVVAKVFDELLPKDFEKKIRKVSDKTSLN